MNICIVIEAALWFGSFACLANAVRLLWRKDAVKRTHRRERKQRAMSFTPPPSGKRGSLLADERRWSDKG